MENKGLERQSITQTGPGLGVEKEKASDTVHRGRAELNKKKAVLGLDLALGCGWVYIL